MAARKPALACSLLRLIARNAQRIPPLPLACTLALAAPAARAQLAPTNSPPAVGQSAASSYGASRHDALIVARREGRIDATEALKIVDYVYFLVDGRIAAHGTADEIRNSTDPFVYQFIRGKPDGPVPFHLPGETYAKQLEL